MQLLVQTSQAISAALVSARALWGEVDTEMGQSALTNLIVDLEHAERMIREALNECDQADIRARNLWKQAMSYITTADYPSGFVEKLKAVTACHITNGLVTIVVPDDYHRQWIAQRGESELIRIFSGLMNQHIDLVFCGD